MRVEADVVREQLAHLLNGEDMLFKYQGSIKTWAVTVWVAVLAAIGTQRIVLTRPMALFVLSAPIILFWFLDGVHGGQRILLREHGVELERRIATKDEELSDLADVFVLSKHLSDQFSTKMRAFLEALILVASNTGFYVGLLVATSVATFVFIK